MSGGDPQSFMDRAGRLALEKMRGNHGGPFGAVIVRGTDIVGEGWNRVTSTNDPTAHAEIVAIRAACTRLNSFDLRDCDIYTNCEPCPMCLGAIYWARLRSIYFSKTRADAACIGFDDDFIYREIALPAGARKIPAVRIECKESDLAFREWAMSPDKQRY